MISGLVTMLIIGCSFQSTTPEIRREILTRASLDLRGYRPNIEEISTVSKSEANLNQMLDKLLEDPNVGDQYASLMAGVWKTEVVEYDHTDHEYAFSDSTQIFDLLTALGQEPLQILAEITRSDLPYSEIVTGDWTMSNAALAQWSPVNYDWSDPSGGWQKVQYTDDRPSAGILVNNGLWWRYNSTLTNAQRGRANVISKMLLCNDFLERRINVDRELNLLDEEGVFEALTTSPTCVSCHVDLDPLAANFWGLYRHFRFSLEEQFSYHPEREMHWVEQTGIGPAYFGSSITSLSDLGDSISQDPALYTCLVQRTMSQMIHQPVHAEDWDLWQPHLSAFVQSGYTIKSLLRSILDDESYRNVEEPKIVTADLFAKQLSQLTQYRFSVDGVDGIDTDLYGLRGLFGGRGKDWKTNPSSVPTTTFSLVVQRLSEAAAYHATHDSNAVRHLFGFNIENRSSATEENLQYIFRKVLSKSPAVSEINGLIELWEDVHSLNNDAVEAWQATLIYLFRHPYFLTY